MAADDIYLVTCHIHGPQRASQFGVYYQESTQQTGVVGPNASLATSWVSAIAPTLVAMLNEEFGISGVEVNKKTGDPDPMFLAGVSPGFGAVPGTPLPSDNSFLFTLVQSLYPKTSHGRIYVPGITEGSTDTGRIVAGFLGTQMQAFSDVIANDVPEISGSGIWQPGVISQKVLNAAPPFKDWDAAFSGLVGVQGGPLIARQVRRRTKVKGSFV